jgi:hypothetical protein
METGMLLLVVEEDGDEERNWRLELFDLPA